MTTSAIQALAMGLPAVTTDHSGFPEQIEEGKNGYLAPEGDYEVFAEKILEYIDHPELWASFGKWGREHMLRKYDSKVLIDTQVALYEEVLGSA